MATDPNQIGFSQSALVITNGTLAQPTALQWGPDGLLYVACVTGQVVVLDVKQTNSGGYSATIVAQIDLVKDIPNHNDQGLVDPNVHGREVTGIAVGGTADHPVVYVSSSDPRVGAGGAGTDVSLDTNSGIISQLTKDADGTWEKVDIVRGLPRSEENHATNGLQLDEANNALYVAQGGNTNAGAPSNNFGGLQEYAYSGAVLKIDLNAIESMPVKDQVYFAGTANQQTQHYYYDLPTLDDPTRPNNGTAGNEKPDGTDVNGPFGGNDGLNQAKLTVDSPVQVYSPGYRNPYDVLLTRDGQLFTYDNGTNDGWGGRPVGEDGFGSPGYVATNQPNNDINDANSQPTDWNALDQNSLHHITGEGYYGGHPNPVRASGYAAGLWSSPGAGIAGAQQLSGTGLPADWTSVVDPSLVDPRQGDYREGGFTEGSVDSGPGSINGLAEYTSSHAFGGALDGAVLATKLSGQLYIILRNDAGGVDSTVSATGQITAAQKQIIDLNFQNTLGIDVQGDGQKFDGTIWITSMSSGILVLQPTALKITSNGGLAKASVNVAENNTAVTTVTATEPAWTPAASTTYSITGGADAALFAIDALTGVLAFQTAPNFEAPTDSGGNNVYDLTVQASDSAGGTSAQAIAVTVTNVSPETITGDGGDNIFFGNPDRESFFGQGGNDTVSYALAHAGVTASLATTGNAKADTGNDIRALIAHLLNSGSKDKLAATGDAANDSYNSIENLTGSSFKDKLVGDDKPNVLEGGPGADSLDGGKGSDTASYEHAAAGITANLDSPKNNAGEAAGDSYASIENLLGSHFKDTLTGNDSDNRLVGGEGNDSLLGGKGNDTLIGGLGADTLNGGKGKDLFVYVSPDEGGDNIKGFVVKDDTLGFSAAGFGGGLIAGQHLDANTFVSNASPTALTAAGTFLYNTGTHDLLWDADGSGAGASVQIAHFDAAVALKADDFNIMA